MCKKKRRGVVILLVGLSRFRGDREYMLDSRLIVSNLMDSYKQRKPPLYTNFYQDSIFFVYFEPLSCRICFNFRIAFDDLESENFEGTIERYSEFFLKTDIFW